MTTSSTLATVPAVDLDRYLGLWYEIARLPMRHEPADFRNITAKYSLNTNGTIKVDNRAVNGKDEVEQSVGEAMVVPDSGNAKLEVSFMPDGLKWVPFTKGDYWILRLDEQYQTALVGSPDRKYLWLLARKPSLPEDIERSFLATAADQGFVLDDLIRTPQGDLPRDLS